MPTIGPKVARVRVGWTEGRDLDKLRRAIGFRCDGAKAGFDGLSMSVLVTQLTARRYKPVLANGTAIQPIKQWQTKAVPPAEEIRLDATALYDTHELTTFAARLSARPTQREQLSSLQIAFLSDDLETIRELGRLYVYRVDDAYYEIDWQLTRANAATVQALATAAFQAHCRLLCYEVDVRRLRRGRCPTNRRPTTSEERVPYGQLALALPL